MKKLTVNISLLSIAFSVIFLFVSSVTKAETQDGDNKDLVSVLHIEAPGHFGPKGDFAERKGHEIITPSTLLVSMKTGLQAFVDLTAPRHPALAPKDIRTDYRALVGFHFPLR